MGAFPLAQQLAMGQGASQRRFNMWQLRQQREQTKLEIAAYAELLDVELETQKKLVDLQIEITDGLTMAIDLLTEAVADLDGVATDDAADAAEARDDIQKDLDTFIAEVGDNFHRMLNSYNRRHTSAGGPIRRNKPKTGPEGWPHPSGTILLVHGDAPHGWLECNGSEQKILTYVHLYASIGNDYGNSSGGSFFVLPSKAKLTADALVLANGSLKYWIRT